MHGNFQPNTHSQKKFDDFGIIIRVAACVPVTFSGQYGSKFCVSYETAFGGMTKRQERRLSPPLSVMSSGYCLFMNASFLLNWKEQCLFLGNCRYSSHPQYAQ